MFGKGKYSVTEPECLKDKKLDFMAAIEAHVRWKVRLEAYLAGTSEEKLVAETVARDDQCILGKWIYGQAGELYHSHPRFEKMKQMHADFHETAGEVIRLTDEGEFKKAKELLCHGEYAHRSHRVKAELARLALEIDVKE